MGESFTRTITMTATDAFAMMLPPLSFPPVDGLGVYPAQPRVSDTSGERGETRVGKRVESVTYVLQKAGEYRLPAIEIDWWDTAAAGLRRASLPELAFNVAANPACRPRSPCPRTLREAALRPTPGGRCARLCAGTGRSPLAVVVALALAPPTLPCADPRVARPAPGPAKGAGGVKGRLSRAGAPGGAFRAQALLAATYRWLDRQGDTAAAARLDRFAQASGDPLLPRLADGLVTSALAGEAADGRPASLQDFVDALARTARPKKAADQGRGRLGPLNPHEGPAGATTP